jgi:hypothetical protein
MGFSKPLEFGALIFYDELRHVIGRIFKNPYLPLICSGITKVALRPL